MEIAASIRCNKQSAPIILVANKCDGVMERAFKQKVLSLGPALNTEVVETSAKDGTGLQELWNRTLQLHGQVSQPSSPILPTERQIQQHPLASTMIQPRHNQQRFAVFPTPPQSDTPLSVQLKRSKRLRSSPVVQEGNTLGEELVNDSKRSGVKRFLPTLRLGSTQKAR